MNIFLRFLSKLKFNQHNRIIIFNNNNIYAHTQLSARLYDKKKTKHNRADLTVDDLQSIVIILYFTPEYWHSYSHSKLYNRIEKNILQSLLRICVGIKCVKSKKNVLGRKVCGKKGIRNATIFNMTKGIRKITLETGVCWSAFFKHRLVCNKIDYENDTVSTNFIERTTAITHVFYCACKNTNIN